MNDEIVSPQDGTNPDVEVGTTESTTDEVTVDTPAEEVLEETVPKTQFNQTLARAKKAEADLKALKAKETTAVNITNKQNSLSEEEVETKILKSQGMSEELISELKAVAKARGKSILDSVSDPIFVAIKNEKDATSKAQKAKLGASKGSGSVRKEKGFNTPGLTDEEHKQLWKEDRDK